MKPLLIAFAITLLVTNYVCANRLNVAAQAPTTVSDEVRQAVELLQKNRVGEAVELLQRATKKNDQDADAWQYLGVMLNRQGKTNDAQRAFEQVVKLRPTSAAPHNGLAACYLAADKLKEAEKEAQAALKLNPKSDEARYFLAVIHLKLGETFSALEEVEKSIEANPAFTAAYALKTQTLIEIFSRVFDPNIKINELDAQKSFLSLTHMFLIGEPTDFNIAKKRFQENQGDRFFGAVTTFERALKSTPQAQDAPQWSAMIADLRFWQPYILDYDKKPESPVIVPFKKLSSPPRLLQMPVVQGVASNLDAIAGLLVVISENGKASHKFMTRRPGLGLAPLVLSVTSKTTFAPATQEGRAVTTMAIIKYKIAGGLMEAELIPLKQ